MKTSVFALALFAVSLFPLLTSAQQQTKPEGSAAQGSPVHSELDYAPEKTRTRVNPFQNDPDAVLAGKILFEDHCLECHGPVAGRSKKGPNLREPRVQNATPGTLFWLLTNGATWKGMPVWSKLPEAQRWQIVCYLKTLGVKDRLKAGEKP